MNVNRVIEVEREDPVHTLQEFLLNWWEAYQWRPCWPLPILAIMTWSGPE